MKKKLIVCVGTLVAAQVLSGCYFLHELDWSKDLVPKGENTTATIGLQPSGANDDTHFFIVFVGEGEGFTPKAPVFDAENERGLKEKLTPDSTIGDLLEENCQTFEPCTFRRGASGVGVFSFANFFTIFYFDFFNLPHYFRSYSYRFIRFHHTGNL